METTRPTSLDRRISGPAGGGQSGIGESGTGEIGTGEIGTGGSGSEWTARPLRLVAHWVQMPTAGGRARLEMVWEVPDPMPPQVSF